MEWTCVSIEQAFGLNRGDVLSLTTSAGGCVVKCAPTVPAETVAEINAFVASGEDDVSVWREMAKLKAALKRGAKIIVSEPPDYKVSTVL